MTWPASGTSSNSHSVAVRSGCTNIPRAAGGAQEDGTILIRGFSSQPWNRFVHLDLPGLIRSLVVEIMKDQRLSRTGTSPLANSVFPAFAAGFEPHMRTTTEEVFMARPVIVGCNEDVAIEDTSIVITGSERVSVALYGSETDGGWRIAVDVGVDPLLSSCEPVFSESFWSLLPPEFVVPPFSLPEPLL